MNLFQRKKKWKIQCLPKLPEPYKYDVQETYCSVARPRGDALEGLQHIMYEAADGSVHWRQRSDNIADLKVANELMKAMGLGRPRKAAGKTWAALESRAKA